MFKAEIGQTEVTKANNHWSRLIPLFLVFLLATVMFFGKLGDFPLFNPDEGYFAEAAREMLETGDYVTTPLNYAAHYFKPPLVVWAMILSFQIFGVNEFAARFFGASCGVGLLIATYIFLERYLGNRIAVIASLGLVTAPLYIGVAHEAITDMPLSLFTAGSLMAFFTAFKEKNQVLKWTGYILVGLAVMTKGPVGFVLPGLIMFVFYLLRGQLGNAISYFQLPVGCLIVAIIALPWYLTEIIVTKGAYFREFIVRENFQRYTSVVDGHKGGWWYHLAVLFGGFLPWSIFLPQAIVRFFRESLKELPKKVGSREFLSALLARFASVNQTQEICLFAICWSFITVAFFSLSVSKLLPYTLPAFPALAMLVSIELEHCIREKKTIRLLIPLTLLAIAYGGAIMLAPQLLSHLKDAPPGLSNIVSLIATVLFFSTLASILLILKSLNRQGIWLFSASIFIATAFYGQKLLPEISAAWEGNIPAYAQYAARSADDIIVFDLRKPGIPFYTRRKVVEPADRPALDAFLKTVKRAYLITKAKNLSTLSSANGYTVIASDSRFALLRWQRAL